MFYLFNFTFYSSEESSARNARAPADAPLRRDTVRQ